MKGWLLLAVFLLMQVGVGVASSCRPGDPNFVEAGASCASTGCCCVQDAADVPACACAEIPAPEQMPGPTPPPVQPGVRDLLPVRVWVEVRSCERPCRSTPDDAALLPCHRRPAVIAVATIPLTVRFCAFLI